jgi:hypothetical protein
MNNMQNMNQIGGFENNYLNTYNMNYMPNDQNIFFMNSSNYYMQMNKMYPNNNFGGMNQNNPGNFMDKK